MLHTSLILAIAGIAATQNQLQVRADSDCYADAPNSTGGPLIPVKTGETTHGFSTAPRGLNSWGMQINPKTTPSAPAAISPLTNQTFIIEQCNVLTEPEIAAAGFDLCSVDGGWYSDVTDDYGRTTYNTTRFDIPALGAYLRSKGLKLGLYNLPNLPCEAANKTKHGTNVQIGTIFASGPDAYGLCYFNYSHPATQLYHDSLIDLWASWGVDTIELDYITPGSVVGDYGVPADTSGAAIAYHRAIVNSGRQIRLDLSSNICRNEPYLSIWQDTSDSTRLAQDLNAEDSSTFLDGMWKVQGTIEQYRLYVHQLASSNKSMALRPDFDNMFTVNLESVSVITSSQRLTVISHWIGAGANLILGSDMTNLDDLGRKLFSKSALLAADFCGRHPMQPRNPGTGSNQAAQLQAWVAGPSPDEEAYVLLTNLGPNLGRGGYADAGPGEQTISVTLADLGLRSSAYRAADVWSGNSTVVSARGKLSAILGEGESQFLRLKPIQ